MGVHICTCVFRSNTLTFYLHFTDKCSGASAEWAKGVLNTPYTYTIELPDRGRYGFVLPASKIDSTVRGMWAGLVALVNAI